MIAAIAVIVTGSSSYVLADHGVFLGGFVTTGDTVLDRTDNENSIVQGPNALAANKGVVYQKIGGGPMTSYDVRAERIGLSGGPVGIGTANPDGNFALHVAGPSLFESDILLNRLDADNSIVQSVGAFDLNRHVIYQKQGGGDMSGYLVRADLIAFSGGNVGIGTEAPTETLDVVGNIQLTGNILSNGDICIGTCPS